jgi:hypothetical protein
MVKRIAHVPDVAQLEGKVMKVGSALVDQRHHVVVGVDVQPHASVAQPVGDPHAQRLGVKAQLRPQSAGEEVDVAKPAGVADRGVSGRPCVGHQTRDRLAVGPQLDAVALDVGKP